MQFNYSVVEPEKSTSESYRIHWNLMNDEEIGSLALLKLKGRKGE